MIKIKTEKEFKDLLDDGYEVVDKYARIAIKKDDDGNLKTTDNYGCIFLEKNGTRIAVDVSEIGALFAMQYEQFADIDGNYMARISNHTLKCDVETYTYDYFNGRRKPCLHTTKLESQNTEKIVSYLKAYVKNEITSYSKNNLGKNLFNIFSNVLIIYDKKEGIDCDVFNKEQLTASKIKEIRDNTKNYENCYAFSFFYLYSKSEFHPDIFIGCILYDVKNQKTISFNLISHVEELNIIRIRNSLLISHCCEKIFEKSIQNNNFLSMMHVTIMHTTYTPLPWIFFAALHPFDYGEMPIKDSEHFINIPEFFVFGISKEFNTKDSFYFQNITEHKRGSAITQYDLVVESKKTNYQLRFDVSKGEQFLHIDFGYYTDKMHKLLSHFPIDMELVRKFNERMFVAMLSSGFYDPEFSKILKGKIKNTAEILKKYKELSEPLKLIHSSEEMTQWIKNEGMVEDFKKMEFGSKVVDDKQYYKISKKDGRVITKDEDGSRTLSSFGLMVLVRLLNGDEPKSQLIKDYLSKPDF